MSRSSRRTFEFTRERRELLNALLPEESVGESSTESIPRLEDRRSAPLSFAQQRLWFLDQLDTGVGYHIPLAMRLAGPLDVEALEKSLDGLLQRHESLRTVFAMEEQSPVQRVLPWLDSSLQVVDLSSSTDADAQVRLLALEEAERPFDLAAGPLFRAALLRLSADDHALLVTMHHIVSDGWSIGIVMRELAALYEAACRGEEAALPILPLQYAEFAAWQRQWVQGEVLEAQLRYWREELKDVSQLSLPLDRPRPPVQTFQGGRESLALEKELSDSLRSLSQREGATLFMTLLAAFQILLWRQTGQEDLVVGSPIANRNRAELEGLVGFFVNSLALRADLSGNPSFRELLGRVRKAALGAYAHQDVPFEKLVEELHPERDVSQNPLFQVIFALQNAPMETFQLPGLTLRMLESDSTTVRFDLELHLWEKREELRALLMYNTDLFDSSTMARMLRHFETLLEGIVAHPEGRISELPMLTALERRQLLVEWNATRRDYPRDACVPELFEAQVERSPDAIAVVFGDEQLTYRELNSRSNRLAHYLSKRGVGPEVLVGLCVERSVEMVVGVLGIVKAGGAYVPLEPEYPQERLAYMLAETEVPVLVTQERLVEGLPEYAGERVCLDADWEAIAREDEGNPVHRGTAEGLIYVIYTSGSTGVPKGIGIPHRGVTRLVWNTDYVELQPSDRVAQASNCSFDAATFEIWGALLRGARLVGIEKEVLLSPRELVARIREQGISVLFLTTALFNQVVREDPRAFGSVRHVLFGGEAVDPRWVCEVLAQDPPERLLHVYGPTESTTFASWYLVEEVAAEATTVPIGRPIANTSIYVLDADLRPVPPGVKGELYIGGDGLARSYLGRSDLTAERFVPDPFSDEPGSRLYRTGDLVRRLPGGDIEFLGRSDHQVKVRGFRIELGDVESVLGQHAGVVETVVLAREDIPGDRRLVAYVVPREDSGSVVGGLRDYLQQKLPPYMVPSSFVLLEALPLTPNGKLDRDSLPAPEQVRPELESSYVIPRTAVERRIAEIWKEVLQIEKIGTHDNFFEIGGHSLLLPRVLGKLEKDSPRKISMVDLFKHPTIYSLAQYLNRDESAAAPPEPDGASERKLQEGKDRLARLHNQKRARKG